MSESALAISGWGVLSPLGTGAEEFTSAWTERRSGLCDVADMFDDPLPADKACAIPGFNVRDHLGRKGTSFFDRSTSLSVVTCGLALADSDLVVDDGNRPDVGVLLGLTTGGPQATAEFIREILISDRPHLVNPVLFPYAVMNGAAGATATWHRLQGVNATISGGQMAFLSVLRYARNKIRNGYARALLAGATEEFSPHRAWGSHQARGASPERVPLGEGSAYFVVEPLEEVRAAGRRCDAEILAIESGLYAEPGSEDDPAEGLAECIERALRRAGVSPDEVRTVAPSLAGSPRRDKVERDGITAALGALPDTLPVKELVGETYSAAGAMQLAAVLAGHRGTPGRDGEISLLTSVTSEGMVGAALVRGWSRAGGDHRV